MRGLIWRSFLLMLWFGCLGIACWLLEEHVGNWSPVAWSGCSFLTAYLWIASRQRMRQERWLIRYLSDDRPN